jgi:hypothetical protein
MPDTGPPWNIPYVEPTDNPRVYPQASEDLAEAIADGLNAAGNEGIGPNVVQTVKLDVFATTSSTFEAITGLAATITPSASDSLVLVIYQLTAGNSTAASGVHTRLMRGTTPLYIGDTASSRVSSSWGAEAQPTTSFSGTVVFVDSPATTDATTYSVQVRVGTAGTARIGSSGIDSDNANHPRVPSSITLIEVKA